MAGGGRCERGGMQSRGAMKASAGVSVLLVASIVVGCGSIDRISGAPSKTDMPDFLPANHPVGQYVAVCYNSGNSTRETVATAAVELCKEPGSKVEYITGDLYLNECPLLKKHRAVFVCHEPR